MIFLKRSLPVAKGATKSVSHDAFPKSYLQDWNKSMEQSKPKQTFKKGFCNKMNEFSAANVTKPCELPPIKNVVLVFWSLLFQPFEIL